MLLEKCKRKGHTNGWRWRGGAVLGGMLLLGVAGPWAVAKQESPCQPADPNKLITAVEQLKQNQQTPKPIAQPPTKVIRLESEALALQFEGGSPEELCLRRIENKLAHQPVSLQVIEGFQIGLEGQEALTSSNFAFRKEQRHQLPDGSQRLCLYYDGRFQDKQGNTQQLSLQIFYQLGPKDFYVRRWLELETPTPLDLRQVVVWEVRFLDQERISKVQQGGGPPVQLDAWASWRLPRAETHGGFGQPVFLGDTFWGLEFPAGINWYEKGLIRLTQHPGRQVQGRWRSKTAVLGVAEPGRVLKRFRQYVTSFQATPPDLNLFVNYNTWWTLMPPTEQNCLQLIETFRKNLWEPFGESFDTFTIDDGWDEKNSLWEIHKERFPRGFEPLVEELKKMNARLGLWVSPSSGYNHAPWGAKAGYEVNSNPWYLCQSGPKYRRDFMQVMLNLTKKYQFAFYKFDGFCGSCEAPGHGHLPGLYAQEANTEAFIELLEAIRREKPDIFLDPTTGMWLSPWWLRYVDAVWGFISGDYPDIVVPAPIVRDSATTTRDAVFRQRCQQHPGFPPSAMEHLGIIVITPEKWEDNAIIVLGRGSRLLTLYINPQFFTKGRQDWAFLASILRWARHNAGTLAQTELILGDPFKREPYGYAHWHKNRGILALRNPFVEPRKVCIPLDETIGWEQGHEVASPGGTTATPADPTTSGKDTAQKLRLIARMVYPRWEVLPRIFGYGDQLEVQLSGYETILIELVPAESAPTGSTDSVPRPSAEPAGPTESVKPATTIVEASEEQKGQAKQKAAAGEQLAAWTPPLAGLPVRELRRQDRQIEYELFGQSGQKARIGLPWGVAAAWVDDQPAALADPSAPLEIAFAGQEPVCKVENFSQKVLLGQGQETAWKIEGTGKVHVSGGVQATLHILFDPKTNSAVPVDCQVKLGDRPVEVRAVRSPPTRIQTHLPHPWTWFEAKLPEGEYQFTWTIQPMVKTDASGPKKDDGRPVGKTELGGTAKPAGASPAKPPYLMAEVGCWVWTERPLVRRVLRLQFAEGVHLPPEPGPWPLPIGIDRSRHIITLQPVSAVRIGSRWTGLSQPVVHLDQFAPNQVEQSWAWLHRGRSVWEKPMTIAGKTFSSGLGTHAESRIAYDLAGGGFKKFRAYIGRDQHALDGEVIFEVWLDGRKVFQSPPMRKDSPAQLVEVDLEGAEWLELRTLPGTDGIVGDHANWADPQLLRE
ncbi:MAG: NPCBM/NEW2 domain-containing protein [Thermoguttaceae bacterium]|nr:NPCBM/NEW2 domain-containing protein [Thermoguttaceae bacterium]